MRTKLLHTPDCPAILASPQEVRQICAEPHRYPQAQVIYQGRNKVILYTHDNGNRYVIKSFKKPNIFQRIAYTWFTPPKSRRAYNYAATLRQRGVSTPGEVACIEEYPHGLLGHSYFVSEYCNAPSLASLWVWGQPVPSHQLQLFTRTLLHMHDAGVLHGDPNISNFLYLGGSDTITTIDTNRTKFIDRKPTRAERLANMVRLTHRRDALADIARQYAISMGWNPDDTANELIAALVRFEQKRHRHKKIKSILFLRRKPK